MLIDSVLRICFFSVSPLSIARTGFGSVWGRHAHKALIEQRRTPDSAVIRLYRHIIWHTTVSIQQKNSETREKNISIKMLKDVGMTVPKSRETSVVYIYAATQGMRDYIYMQQDRG